MPEKIHLIAIGGSAMHNLALSLHHKGLIVTGSDDEINEPSKSRLAKYNLLPEKIGWYPEKITSDINKVILGMHAREDNPELIRAKELGIPVFSYPEFLYEVTKEKKRIVIGGSHGKTSITAMILHVFKKCGIDTDYMVGAQLEGFDTMVKLTNEAPIAVFEGDEYLASPIDRRSKFHLYHPNIAVISGIAWDHINVFPTFEIYKKQFGVFIDLIEENGQIIYCENDENVVEMVNNHGNNNNVQKIPYSVPPHEITNGITNLKTASGNVPLEIFGEHNLMNLMAAKEVCNLVGINDKAFYDAIGSFKGAAKRLEPVYRSANFSFFKDFAHSPSKLKATTQSVKKQFPDKKLIACMELHTFSSLNENFLNEYNGSMKEADEAIVYFNPKTIAHKKLKAISIDDVKKAFSDPRIIVFTESDELVKYLKMENWNNKVLLMMSSGNFDGIDFTALSQELNLS
ncbi:MAG: UDP-N-acetylmuramate--L-alanine ligase [Bacteroidia bacterium]